MKCRQLVTSHSEAHADFEVTFCLVLGAVVVFCYCWFILFLSVISFAASEVAPRTISQAISKLVCKLVDKPKKALLESVSFI